MTTILQKQIRSRYFGGPLKVGALCQWILWLNGRHSTAPPPPTLKNVRQNFTYDELGFSIGTPIYMNVVHIIFFFPIVTPPLTWLFLLEHRYIQLIQSRILLHIFEGGSQQHVSQDRAYKTITQFHLCKNTCSARNLTQVATVHKLMPMQCFQAAWALACAHWLPETDSLLHKRFHLNKTE